MKLKKWLVGLIALALCFSFGMVGMADDDLEAQLNELRELTEKYKDVNVAIADGYEEDVDEDGNPNFVANPELGGMGVHFINGAYVADGEVDALKPEVLVYEPVGDGEYELVAIEYLTVGGERPSLYGQEFDDGPFEDSFALHVWIWKEDPSGMFAPYNPNVTAEEEGMPLPETATNVYNMLFAGSLLLVIGVGYFLFQRRKSA